MTFSFVAQNSAVTAFGSGTTSATNMVGANLIIEGAYWFVSSTPSDNQGNSYTSIVSISPDTFIYTQAWYCVSPTVSSSMTFTNAANNASFCVAGYSGAATSFTLDASVTSNTALAGSSVQPGSITPANNDSLCIGVVGVDDATTGLDAYTTSIGSIISFRLPAAGQTQGSAIAASIQSGAPSAFNPTLGGWTAGARNAALAFAFKPDTTTPPWIPPFQRSEHLIRQIQMIARTGP